MMYGLHVDALPYALFYVSQELAQQDSDASSVISIIYARLNQPEKCSAWNSLHCFINDMGWITEPNIITDGIDSSLMEWICNVITIECHLYRVASSIEGEHIQQTKNLLRRLLDEVTNIPSPTSCIHSLLIHFKCVWYMHAT